MVSLLRKYPPPFTKMNSAMIAQLKKELNALSIQYVGLSKYASNPKDLLAQKQSKQSIQPKKPRKSGKFGEWNAFVLETQKDMARLAGLPSYESYPSHKAFITAATDKGCGRVAALKEASRRREEASGEKAFVKIRAEKWAAEADTLYSLPFEPTTYRERWIKRYLEQSVELNDDTPMQCANGCSSRMEYCTINCRPSLHDEKREVIQHTDGNDYYVFADRSVYTCVWGMPDINIGTYDEATKTIKMYSETQEHIDV